MKINEWLETKDINPIDEITLGALEEFVSGTHFALAKQSVALTREHQAWQRSNTLTKREQFAGFALIGLAGEIDKYASLGDMKLDIDALADMMVAKTDE